MTDPECGIRAVCFVEPQPGWARRATDFDARAFAKDAWPYEQWVYELSEGRGIYRALVEPDGLNAIPRILAIGGVGTGIEAEILTIAVAPELRGRGIGGELLDELMGIAMNEGAEQIFLEVRSQDPVAQGMYVGRGFVPVGIRKHYYSDDDAVVMRFDVPLGR